MRQRNKRFFRVVLLALLGAPAGCSVGAPQAHDTSNTSHNGWLYFNVKPLPHSTRFVTNPGRDVQGQCINGGSFQGSWGAGGAEQEVAINLATCQILWERGDPPHQVTGRRDHN